MRPLVAAASAAFALGVSTATLAATSDLESTHESRTRVSVSPGQLLTIRLDTGAGLRIVGWNRDEVLVASDWHEHTCPDAVIHVGPNARGASLETHYRSDSGDVHHCSMTIEVHVPTRFNLHIQSAGGGIGIEGVEGTFEGHTGGGRLNLSRVHGRAELTTGGGEIVVRDSDLDGRLATGGGHVSLDNVHGDVTASSGSERGVRRGSARAQ